MASQELNIQAVVSSSSSSGDTDSRSAPSNVPDYGIKLVDVVLNSNQLKVVLDTSEGQEPPTNTKPYKEVDITITYQELPDGEMFILSKPHIQTLSNSKVEIDLSLISPAIPEPTIDYKIGVTVSAKNSEEQLIHFNDAQGSMSFSADMTAQLSSN